ncbi:(2Fe-2S)-binding protein [Sphingomonas xanthus]|uniref:Bacterioferritin-associated ferredoxin n=1 Tax=Sphingomonas xanthus TaxID=2594473 RepID=A0A516IQI8_9SPHN|nr:(2Fe-2S)-binding protein [Sphingomonas xanthus]QDP19171.1 (2Fe-2S)-binding protein [Sphingomonas xanthus]
MIVCSCNVIRANDIRAAVRRGCADSDSCYRAMGCEFQCGGCRDMADEIVDEMLARPRDEAAQAA